MDVVIASSIRGGLEHILPPCEDVIVAGTRPPIPWYEPPADTRRAREWLQDVSAENPDDLQLRLPVHASAIQGTERLLLLVSSEHGRFIQRHRRDLPSNVIVIFPNWSRVMLWKAPHNFVLFVENMYVVHPMEQPVSPPDGQRPAIKFVQLPGTKCSSTLGALSSLLVENIAKRARMAETPAAANTNNKNNNKDNNDDDNSDADITESDDTPETNATKCAPPLLPKATKMLGESPPMPRETQSRHSQRRPTKRGLFKDLDDKD